MTNKKDLIIAILATFCLTATLFMIIPSRSSNTGQYDPWCDLNDDGKIDILDVVLVTSRYGATGTPINKTALLLELQNRIIELEERVSYLERLHPPKPSVPDWFSGLVGYWKFDEGIGIVLGDSSGNSNNGTLVNGPSWATGKEGNALSFDGIDDYVEIPDSPSLRVQAFTLEAWIYMTKRPYQHGDVSSAIINKLDFLGGSGTKGYKLMFEGPSSSNDHLVISVGDGITQRFLIDYNSINDLTLYQWHQVVGTYDGITAEIFIDGELKSSNNVTFTVVNNDAPLGIGQEVTAATTGPGHFCGLIDNAMIYNRSINADEVYGHYVYSPP